MPRKTIEGTIANVQTIRDAIRAIGNVEQVVLVATPRRLSQLRAKCDTCNCTGKAWGVKCPECRGRSADKVGSLDEIFGISFFEAATDIEVITKATDLHRRTNAKVLMAIDGWNEIVECPEWLINLM